MLGVGGDWLSEDGVLEQDVDAKKMPQAAKKALFKVAPSKIEVLDFPYILL